MKVKVLSYLEQWCCHVCQDVDPPYNMYWMSLQASGEISESTEPLEIVGKTLEINRQEHFISIALGISIIE